MCDISCCTFLTAIHFIDSNEMSPNIYLLDRVKDEKIDLYSHRNTPKLVFSNLMYPYV